MKVRECQGEESFFPQVYLGHIKDVPLWGVSRGRIDKTGSQRKRFQSKSGSSMKILACYSMLDAAHAPRLLRILGDIWDAP